MPRRDGDEKVRGACRYIDDLPAPGAWHGFVVRSPVSCGRLRGLTLDPAFDWGSVCVVTPADIPGENLVHMFGLDMPFLAHDAIQYRGEPLALVAAPTRRLAREAAAHVKAEIDPLPAVLTLDEVVARHRAGGAGLHALAAQTIVKGDAERALAAATHVVEGTYQAGHQEQLYIEPQGMVCTPEPDGGVLIEGSLQCPYYISPELVPTLGLPLEKIRVRQAAVGGAFGGKEEFPTLLAGYCALLALKCRRPVKIIYDRHQDMLYTTKRHPVWAHYRTGLHADGTLAAFAVDFVLDGGAYTTLSPVVLSRGVLHSTLGYRCADVHVSGHVYRTNTFPCGAFRGFGAPQAIWGLESHMDRCAAAAGLSPDAFRLRNALRLGDATATGQVIAEPMGTPGVLEAALERSGYAERRARCSRGSPHDRAWYGIGLAFFGHGSGFTGDGESRLKSRVALDLEPGEDGGPAVHVRVSSTEMGQGTLTIMPQIVADGLGCALEHVRMPLPDTKYVPDSGPTVASRSAMVVGGTLYGAARKLRGDLEQFASGEFFGGAAVALDDDMFRGPPGAAPLPFARVASAFLRARGAHRVYHQFQLPAGLRWDQKTFVGDAYPSYSWGCNVVELEVNPATLEIAVTRVTAVFDIGRVINPVLASGQIEGGLVQALGYALMEKTGIKDGLYDANRMQTYIVPTMPDAPEIDVHFLEFPFQHAPPGAKGVGEIPMDGLAPAIANAVEAATGLRITRLPITPEALLAAGRGRLPS